ncbi:MAG: hypothetical protein E7513_00005 [Ruminococcaceae bacterium]|nr:hypothetical protein [Oscillospiraceae bacterium]
MKTISSRFLKGALAMLLAVVMLFGTTLTGFAAVVDNADTSANVDVADTGAQYNIYWQGHIYFLAPETWNIDTYKYIQVDITRTTSASSSNYQFYAGTMTRIGTSRLFYLKINADHRSWGQNEYITFTANSSTYGSGTFTLNTNHNYMVPLDYGVTNANGYYLFKPSSEANNSTTTNGNSMNGSYNSNRSTLIRAKQTVNIYTDGTQSGAGGTIKMSGYYDSGTSSIASSSDTSTTSTNTISYDATQGSAMTLSVASTTTGYKFDGWYTAATGGTKLSSNTSYTYNVFNTKTVYARFVADGYTYTVTAGDGGTVSPTSGTATSATITATPDTGYEFAGWQTTNGTVANASAASTTFTPSANGANAHATFVKKTYTVRFLGADGSVLKTDTVAHGDTPVAPTAPAITGKTFAGWTPTVSAVTGITDYTATYTDNMYSITVNQTGGTGTVTLGKTSAKYGDTVTISVTPPAGYNIASITGATLSVGECETYSGSFTMPANNVTINVTYVVAGSCALNFAYGDQSLVLGDTFTNIASANEFCNGGNITYSSSTPTVATVNSATGLVTAKKPGTTTITATCSADGTTATYVVTVKSPSVTVPALSVDVNGTATAAPVITNGPASGYTITYTSTSTDFSVTTSGTVTGIKPATGAVSYTMTYGGNTVASGTFNVTVNTPAYSITPKAVTLITGQTMEDAFVTTADGNPEVTFSAGSTDVISISGGKATALKAGLSTVRAAFKYNDSYTAQAMVNVTVVDPLIDADKDSVALEVDGGTQSTTVTIETNAVVSEVTPEAVTVTSANANVATATLDGDTITITATGVGSTTVTAKFYDATVEIPVTVTKYDPYVYLYVTDSQGWDNMFLHSWKGSNDNVTTLGQSNAQMIYIGRNGDNAKIFAYKFLKGTEPEKVIMVKTNSWPSDNLTRTDDYAVDFSKGYAALYIDSSTNSSGRRNTGNWTDDCMIVRPTVSVEDVVVPVGSTETATATVENGGVVYWTTADTTKATVADVTTATSTVTGQAVGDTTITARAFIDTTKSSIKTLPSNYKTDTDCWDFISTAATANVTVGSVDYTVNVNAQYSDDGTTYVDGTQGGTVRATKSKEEGYEELTLPAQIAHGKTIEVGANAKSGYRFVGWYKNNNFTTSVGTATGLITADTTYTARFVKQHNVSVILGDGIESIRFNNVSYSANFDNIPVDAGATITVLATPAESFKFDSWTVEGTEVADPTLAQITISDVQSSLTLTANAIPTYKADYTVLTNGAKSTTGGTVTTDFDYYAVGDEIKYTATPKSGYEFIGFYDVSDVEFKYPLEFTEPSSRTYTTTATQTADGVHLVAVFAKYYHINGAILGGASEVQLVYNPATDTYQCSLASIPTTSTGFYINSNYVKVTDIAADNDGSNGILTVSSGDFTFDLDDADYSPENIVFTLTKSGSTYALTITATPLQKANVYYVDGDTPILINAYAIGSQVTITANFPQGKYLSGATSDPAVDLDVNSDNGNITFTMPDTDITITPQFTQYAYVEFTDTTGLNITGLKTAYKAGEAVEITVAPATAQVSIENLVADSEDATITKNDDGTYTITATLAAGQIVTITPTIDAKFAMKSKQVSLGNYGTGVTAFGTVAMSVDGETITEGTYVEKTDTVTYTASASTNYIFDGFYADEACTQLLTHDATYDVTPTKDTTVYALFVRRQWLAEDQAVTSNNTEMTYDPDTRSFTYESSTLSKTAWFRVTNDLNGWNDSKSYCQFDSTFSVKFNTNSYKVSVGWGTQCWALTCDSDAEYPFTVILTPDWNKSVDISVRAAKVGNTVYLSSGRVDIPGSYDSAVFDAVSEFTPEETDAKATSHDAKNENEIREHYKKLNLKEAQTITFKTTLSGTNAANYYVDKYVVYHINTETYTIVTPNTLGNNTYSGSVYADGDCYIVPIFFHTEEYAAANGLMEIDIYFDATAISTRAWGPFVACYAWGSNGAEYTGGWSGQLMIPTEDGSSFYTMITVPRSDDTDAVSVPQGVTFNNYMQSTVPGDNPGAFGVSSTQYQCYDYREPITLYEAGYDVITFVAKDSTDGYHGERFNNDNNNNTDNPITSETTDIFTKFDFDYLYSRDGVTPMDLNGEEIANPVDINVSKADYYIVNKGDITYDPSGTTYPGDTGFDADWGVDWYVFDSNGTYLTNILSNALYHDTDGDGTTLLLENLGLTTEDVAGKTVAISYERYNNAGHQISYDGQWYGNMLEDYVRGDVLVGLIDDNNDFVIDTEDPTNEAYYGEGYLVDEEGNKHASLEILMDVGEADLSATAKDGYRFVGWYTRRTDGTYVQISKAYDYNTYINMNTTYYAMFRQIGDDEVVINHLTYNNPDDPYIPSHNGVSEMYVEVYHGDELIASGDPSTARSTATFPAEYDAEYTIKIYTTPLMNGTFFAWYTDSETADGNKTYEEIMTEAHHVGSKEQVVTEFTYTYEIGAQKVINIYSDVTRVSNKATLYYRYLNRNDVWRTYTVKDVPLTDEECLGFPGNEGKEYCPAYLDAYTFRLLSNGQEVTVYGDDRYNEYISNGNYEYMGSFNKIQYYAPSDQVTQVFNGTVAWNVTDTLLSTENAIITLYADQGLPQYTINYTIDGEVQEPVTGYYNELTDIVAPTTNAAGQKFSYWYDHTREEIATYSNYYRYRIVEEKSIEAVYGVDLEEDTWTPSIDSVTYTREYSDTGDYIYTDFLLAYNNTKGKELNKIKETENIQYGLIMARDPQVAYDGNGDVVYPEKIDADMEIVALAGKNKKVNGINYYCYDITSETLTNRNRCDYVKRFNNKSTDSAGTLYRQYAFTCVAYLVRDGEVFLSNPMNVNFYDVATRPVESN